MREQTEKEKYFKTLCTKQLMFIFYPKFPTSLTFKDLITSNSIINSSVMVRRAVFSNEFSYVTSARARAVEDYATWLRISTKYRLLGIDEPLIFYNDIGGSIRSEDLYDPRIHAFADFILWSRSLSPEKTKKLKKHRRGAFRAIRREYLK